ncbi:hypothetical protein GTQ45_14505 [Pyruvatibacter mobilis]|uniref:Uncharacterized protein n=1 Tax=Pyruvatibacter mobilis TaxID=1712261 RepID=A0A845QES4_9HYPH|nr:hypothetical protein [Pyruvatibacter mobilis]NBG96947.1 hypothetical protein [Pyruvatibacter mobilis]QJD74675.1 hypothetical protein HG718_04215 [Pyruvatibacter mobilis]GGD09204.1 hypothetical protein GCM10011587_11350 [Pyruvatibacter mobilis]
MLFARRILWILGFAAFVIAALNIEKFAEFLGIDQLLIFAMQQSPEWVQAIWEMIKSGTAITVYLCIASYIAGLKTQAARNYITRIGNKPISTQAMADECEQLALDAEAAAPLADRNNIYLTRLSSSLLSLKFDFLRGFGHAPRLEIDSSENALETARILKSLALPLRDNDLEEVRAMIIESTEVETSQQQPS